MDMSISFRAGLFAYLLNLIKKNRGKHYQPVLMEIEKMIFGDMMNILVSVIWKNALP